MPKFYLPRTTPRKRHACVIPMCQNKTPELVHKFPNGVQRCEQWLRAINVPSLNKMPIDAIRGRLFVCSEHFRQEDYKHMESRSLNITAVPSLNFYHQMNGSTEDNETTDFSIAIDLPEGNANHNATGKNASNHEHESQLKLPYSPPDFRTEKVGCRDDELFPVFINDIEDEDSRGMSADTDGIGFSTIEIVATIREDDLEVDGTTEIPLSENRQKLMDLLAFGDYTETNYDLDMDLVGSVQDSSSIPIESEIEHIDVETESVVEISETNSNDMEMELLLPGAIKPITLNYIWLRDHCRCEKCYDVVNSARITCVLDIPLDVHPVSHFNENNQLFVQWSDGHQSSYQFDFLEKSVFGYSDPVSPKPKLWLKEEITKSDLATVSLNDLLCNDDVIKTVIRSLIVYGVAFIKQVPATELSTEMAIKRLFPIYKTFFGEMWTFSDNKDHSDSAYSTEHLPAHTDNTYFNDAAGLQILHCIQHKGTGGETLLVDGFRVLKDLKDIYPDVYNRLCKYDVPGEYLEEGKHHSYSAPIIRLNSKTNLPEQIRFNIGDRAVMTTLPQSQMFQFYKDLQLLTKMIRSQEYEWWFKLEPGTVMIFDNWRLLHGRSKYTGKRVLTGSYVQRTEFMSAARVLKLID